MANKDAAFGFRPVRHLTGGLIRTNEYKIAANYATSIFQGTPVLAVTAGGIEIADDSSGTPSVILGIFGGCFYTDPTTSKPTFSNYWPGNAATDAVAFIYDSPMDVFEMQADAAFPVADLFGNFDIVDNTGTGSTASGISYVELDVSTGATTATLPVKALDISQDPENSDVSTANTNVLVTIQNHLFGQKQVGLA